MSGAESGTLAVLGAGGHGRVIADAALASSRWNAVVFFDDASASRFAMPDGWSIAGPLEACLAEPGRWPHVVVGIGGDPALRGRLLERIAASGREAIGVVHPTAAVSPFATLGAGTVVCATAVVGLAVRLGDGVIVNTGASVDHDCVVGRCAHVSPGARLAGEVRVGEAAWIGMGTQVAEGRTIGAGTVVGAGSTVLDDLPDGVVAHGTPARVVRRRDAS